MSRARLLGRHVCVHCVVSSAADFADITLVISASVSHKIEFCWPCSEHRGKDFDQRSDDTYWEHI